jgi:hypothetical protein
MTDLKIKEKISVGLPTCTARDIDEIKVGDMFYSYEYDTLLLIADDTEFGRVIVDLTDATIAGLISEDTFEEIFAHYEINYGPFYLVDKAKIKFKVGE